MGRAKEEMMHQEALEPFYEWVNEYRGGDAGEEGTTEWEEAFRDYQNDCARLQQFEEDSFWKNELEWQIDHLSQIDIFQRQIISVEKLLEVDLDGETEFSLLVMLHGHVVAAVEAYLSSTFIHKVTNSEWLTRKLVETDPAFSKKKLTLKELFEEHEKVKFTVAEYLRDLIFHDLKKIKPMYFQVIGYDFGDISWLFQAIRTRHHCVHRAGLDKEGNEVELSASSIKDLVAHSSKLINDVENHVREMIDIDDIEF